MVLYLIGLGLGDEKDITVRGLELIKKCRKVFLEKYTSILGVNHQQLETFFGCTIDIAYRETVEQEAETILEHAKTDDVALLVVGDPFGATTHIDLATRARSDGIEVKVVHNASIMTAVGICGLQLYHFGETVSMVFFTETWKPDSWYDKVARNAKSGLHTLMLLDIKVREPTDESLARGKPVYQPPRFMTVKQCLDQCMEIEAIRKEGVFSADTPCVGLARVGQDTQRVVYGTLSEVAQQDLGGPLHSLALCGPDLHFLELEALEAYRIPGSRAPGPPPPPEYM